MKTLPRVSLGQDLHHFQSVNFPSTTLPPSFQNDGFYNLGALYPVKQQSFEEPISTAFLTSELPALSLEATLCPLCKGQKYGFTAYLHNLKIFPEPPHDLLPFIEKSYVLKNRLKSLLVTYIMRNLEQDGAQEAEKEVQFWGQLVEGLLSDVAASAVGFELSLYPLEEVWKWTEEMTRQIRESIAGRQKMEMPKGRLLALLLELRKLWEEVWKQYLLDRHGSAN